MSAQGRQRRAPAVARPARPGLPPAFLIASAVFLLCAAYVMPFMPDDAFISFRYAEHLADGHGLTFNVGERPVEAYSNFLWILCCALLHKAGLHLPQVTPYAGILLGMACLAVLWDLCRRRAPLWTQQLAPLLAFAAFGPFVLYAVSGMETALFALLLLWVVRCGEDLIAAFGPRPLAAFAFCAFLAALARPEGVVVFPVALLVVAWELRRDGRLRAARRPLAIALAAVVAATVVYHAWRVWYFGEWLPTPFVSKGVEDTGLLTGWRVNLTAYFVNWTYHYPPVGYAYLALLVLALGAGHAAARAGAGGRGDRLAIVLAVVFAAVYLNFVDWMPGMRYHVALVGLLLVPASSLHIAAPESWWRAAAGAHARRFAALALAFLLACGAGLASLKSVAVTMNESAEACNLPLAAWLRTTLPAGALLAIADVGAVPYYAGLRTLDIHPQSLTDAHIAQGTFSADYVLRRKPHIVLLPVRGVFSSRMDPLHWTLYQHPAFRDGYGFVGTVRDQWYQDRAYWVFLRNDVPVSDDALRALPAGIGKQRRTRFDP